MSKENYLNINDLIDKRVINVHRENKIEGTIKGFDNGVNGGTIVCWDGRDYDVSMVTSDLALVSDWPNIDENGNRSYIRLSERVEQSNENDTRLIKRKRFKNG